MIKLVVVSYNSEAPDSPISALFGAEAATIGRNVENFLALPDPKHFVSRTQAKLWSTGDRHFLHNLSLANPIIINGKEIEAETDVEIHPGDQLQIGLYLLGVEATEAEPLSAPASAAVTDSPESAEAAPLAEPADAIEPQKAEQVTPPAQAQPALRSPAAKAEPASPPQFLLRPEVQKPPTDAASQEKPAVEKTVPTVAAVAATPVTEAETAKGEASKPAQAAHCSNGNTQELMQAFLHGAGLTQLNLSSGLTVELMETLGKFMASSVQGALEELSQRALLKREVKAEVTMVVLRENNPLKFFPDSKTVMTQMLRKKMPGFMAPAEAMEDAFFDIRTHQLGVAAGSRAVTDAILKTLQPASVEAHLASPGLLDQINPARRKAAMWDHYSELFDTISSGKKDEFQSLFGKEFLIAYEKEVDKAESDRL